MSSSALLLLLSDNKDVSFFLLTRNPISPLIWFYGMKLVFFCVCNICLVIRVAWNFSPGFWCFFLLLIIKTIALCCIIFLGDNLLFSSRPTEIFCRDHQAKIIDILICERRTKTFDFIARQDCFLHMDYNTNRPTS